MVIEALSPIHIGTGRELSADVDYVVANHVYVIDLEWMLAHLNAEQLARAMGAEPLSRLLSAEDREEFARYILERPASKASVPQLREQIKDLDSDPYIPGSSLKGAVRTALLWAMTFVEGLPSEQPRADQLERELLTGTRRASLPGSDPNFDLLRAFRPADSYSASAEDDLELLQVGLYSLSGRPTELRRKPEEQFFVEAMAAGTQLQADVSLDEYLLRPEVARRLGLDGKQNWIRGWLTYCHAYGSAVIEHEVAFYSRFGPAALEEFYRELKKRAATAEAGREAVLPLAWGTGWHGKTIGTALEEEEVDEIRTRYRLGRQGYPVFPKSRRLVERNGEPVSPLGWVFLRIAEESIQPYVPPLSLEQARAYRQAEQEARRVEPAPEQPRDTGTPPSREPGTSPAGPPRRIEELKAGMVLEGVVAGIAKFGVFVNVGIREDGLVHVSELSERRVENIEQIVQKGQRVRVRVLGVDLEQRRIKLSMKGIDQQPTA
jgi:CRISPR-associated protein Csm5